MHTWYLFTFVCVDNMASALGMSSMRLFFPGLFLKSQECCLSSTSRKNVGMHVVYLDVRTRRDICLSYSLAIHISYA